MSSENGENSHQEGSPPPMDEAWWDAILAHEETFAQPGRRGEGHRGDKGNNQGAPEDWVWARDLFETDQIVDLKVIGYNRGGVLVEALSLRGFVPVSHLVSSIDHGEEDRATYLASLVGKTLCLKVIEFDPERGRLVLSERAALSSPGKRIEVLSNLRAGDKVTGKVTNITRFGVFVDLGGVEGLVHVSELSWGRVRHPSDVVQLGSDLEVLVLSVDPDQCRVALSLKELLPDPWASVNDRYVVGEVVSGVVTNVVKFGAFVGIEEGLEGLIHTSELGDGQFLHPRSVIKEGEQVRARVVNIDMHDRRLGLSLRDVPPQENQMEGTSQNGLLESWGMSSTS